MASLPFAFDRSSRNVRQQIAISYPSGILSLAVTALTMPILSHS
jgi:hypothetical protein